MLLLPLLVLVLLLMDTGQQVVLQLYLCLLLPLLLVPRLVCVQRWS